MILNLFITTITQVLIWSIIARALLSWFPGSRRLASVRTMVNDVTDPLLQPIQRRLPSFGGLDLSPMIAIVLISVFGSLAHSLVAGY